MEATIAQSIPTRVSLLEQSHARTQSDVDKLAKKIDKLILATLGAAIALLAEIALHVNSAMHLG